MGAPADSDPSLSGAATGGAAPAGLGPGQRPVVAGRYRLLDHIAEGGMGSVYLAQHTLSRKKLALKVVHPYLCRGRQGVERFRREVSAAAEIDHPGIVQVYDAGVDDDGGFFMAMELLNGESLGDRLRREWPGMATAVRWIEGMLEPLAKAHAKDFIHRDLKPDNVFLAVDAEGRQRIKILDFGLAREVSKGGPTRTGLTFGTPEYMSPEQAVSARKVRSPGDVWSVGVMLYELLSGVHPFTGETPNAIMANAIKEPLPPLRDKAPHVPEPLARLVERCLEKEPERRPQTAGEMLEELRAVLPRVSLDETVPAAPTPPAAWSEDEEPDIAVSSSFPVESRPRRQADVRTELMDREAPVAASPAPAPSKGPGRGLLLLGLAALGALVVVAAGGGVLWWALAGDGSSEAVAAERAAAAGPAGATPDEAPADGAEAEDEAPASAATAGDAPGAAGADGSSAGSDEAAASPSEAPRAGADGSSAGSDEAAASPSEAPRTGADEAAASADAPGPSTAPRRARRQADRRARARAAAEPEGPSALEEARECMARGDRACARRVLEGRARTAAEHAMLIDLYRSSGRIPQALDAMERFVRRFRRAPQAAEYREYLQRYGR